MQKNRKLLLAALVVLVVGGLGYYFTQRTPTTAPSAMANFAQCLKDSGTKFYGAFWCPHCQAQEQTLQRTREQLAAIGLYTECSKPDGQSQTAVCVGAKITSYPTWVWPDHSTSTGVQTIATLAEKTGCTLPTTP